MRQKWAATLLALVLVGCKGGGLNSASDAAPPSLLPVSKVVNAIKCELAETFQKRPEFYDLLAEDDEGADIGAELELSNAVTRSVDGSAGLEVQFGGLGVSADGGASRSRATGQTVGIEFSYDLDRTATAMPAFCATLAQDVRVKGDPFVELLAGVQSQYQQLGAGEPRVKLGAVNYGSNFEVDEEASGGVKISFLVFSIGGNRSVGRSSGQSLNLAFQLNLARVLLNQ